VKRLIEYTKRYLPSLVPLLLPSLLLGMAIGLYPGYQAYKYIWKDAGFCLTCHQHDYAQISWQESVHGEITTCHDCHHQPLRQYVEEMFVLATQDSKHIKHIPNIQNELCEACHISNPHSRSSLSGPLEDEDLEGMPMIDKTQLHALHLSEKTTVPLPKEFAVHKNRSLQQSYGRLNKQKSDQKKDEEERLITCVDCHGGIPNRAHNFSATDASCANCHEKTAHKPSELQESFGCRICHFPEFLIEQ
jgi:hypothetical protein